MVDFSQGEAGQSLRFRLLGPLQVIGERGAVPIPPGRQETILAALLLEVNRVVTMNFLVDLIWNDKPPETARTQVQICVSRLRKLFAAEGLDAAITTRPPGYVLTADENAVDAAVFTQLVAKAWMLKDKGQRAEAVAELPTENELRLGDFLSGLASEPLRSKAQQLDEERLTAIEIRLELELELGRHRELIGELQYMVHLLPLRERLRGQLMLALYRSARQAEALETYRRGRELLAEELGLDPGDELRKLEASIFASDPALLYPSAGPQPGEPDTGGPRSPVRPRYRRRSHTPRCCDNCPPTLRTSWPTRSRSPRSSGC